MMIMIVTIKIIITIFIVTMLTFYVISVPPTSEKGNGSTYTFVFLVLGKTSFKANFLKFD
jgi:hypothetical protein